jgi:hypothetical protein
MIYENNYSLLTDFYRSGSSLPSKLIISIKEDAGSIPAASGISSTGRTDVTPE